MMCVRCKGYATIIIEKELMHGAPSLYALCESCMRSAADELSITNKAHTQGIQATIKFDRDTDD